MQLLIRALRVMQSMGRKDFVCKERCSRDFRGFQTFLPGSHSQIGHSIETVPELCMLPRGTLIKSNHRACVDTGTRRAYLVLLADLTVRSIADSLRRGVGLVRSSHALLMTGVLPAHVRPVILAKRGSEHGSRCICGPRL